MDSSSSSLPSLSSTLSRRRLLQVGGGVLAGSLVLPKLAFAAGSVVSKAEHSLNLYHIHTGEFLKEVIWADGEYIQETLAQANHFLRDWRTGQSIEINKDLLHLLHHLSEKVDAKKPFEIYCGYRSPKTNTQLRHHKKGVARNSQHLKGNAVDFRIPGVSLPKLRNAALAAKKGGVGYYPQSNFVHVDIRPQPVSWS